ncbi:phosphoglycolate phosphatase [Bradyrhizobium sp. USDA 4532]|nr:MULTISPECIES: HAD hydrolase-like protein [unclassified Bradyrhizobium]MCP1835126.1 phosphoglycolate phosphatase [Bradyrhizobium sp. USDA 4545]MCP1919871.1 phosphoglycolate phosphatase [Bradyrhizobium sp. USDA 4532]
MKSAVVFDWNGTLLDDANAVLQTINAILSRFGRSAVDMHRLREEFELPLSVLFRNLDMSEDEIEVVHSNDSAIFHDVYEFLARNAALRKGARNVLLALDQRSVQTVIVSNHIIEPIRTQVRRLGIKTHVTDILAFESRATQFRSMSKQERLRLYMQANDLSPERTVIVGDMPVETEIARNLGLINVSITGGFVSEARLCAAGPDYMIHDHHELLPVLRKHCIVQSS